MDKHFYFYTVYGPDDRGGELVIKVTEEGIIVDLNDEETGETVGTFAATAQELTDDFIH